MKRFLRVFPRVVFLPALFAFHSSVVSAAAAAAPLRLVETTPELATLFLTRSEAPIYELALDAWEEPVRLLVPADAVHELSALVHQRTGKCGGFLDVTDEDLAVLAAASERARVAPRGADTLPPLRGRDPWVERAVDRVDPSRVESFVKAYSGRFSTRYANSAEGEEAPRWLAQQWKRMAEQAGRGDVVVALMDPPSYYEQNSARITIPGADPSLPYVILGGHLDSINHKDGERAPGVDDNGSGISALTEAYRVLLAEEFRPRATVQLFGYSAEEVGLRGSRAIAERYSRDGARVRGVLQLDMVAFPGSSRALTFIDDHVNGDLTAWTEQVYGLYVGGEVLHDRCGYACSDHASWTRYGFPSVFPFEAPSDRMNGRIHSTKDIWDSALDAGFSARFAKLAVAFAAELAK